MSDTLQARELPLRKVMSDEFVFRIPHFQRPYCWSREQAGELMDDLLAAVDDHADDLPVGEMRSYFLGSVVLIKRPDKPEADVVDGQQRLTTLTLLLALLRDAEPDPGRAEALNDLIFSRGNPLLGTEGRYRLSLRPRENERFVRMIERIGSTIAAIGGPVAQADDNLTQNAAHIARVLRTLPLERRRRLMMFVIERCYFVVVCAEDRDAAYRIFSVINHRGLNLSDLDIVKSEIVARAGIGEEGEAALAAEWELIESDLGRGAFEVFFTHLLFALRGRRVRSIVQDFRALLGSGFPAHRFVPDVLVPYVAAHDVLDAEPADPRPDPVARSLFALRVTGITEWIGPALRFRVEDSDPVHFAAFLDRLERLTYYLLLRRDYTGERLVRYGRLIDWIAAAEDPFDAESPLSLTADETAEFLALLVSPATSTNRIRLPVMLRAELALSGRDGIDAIESIHLETVGPARSGAPGLDADESLSSALGNCVLIRRRKSYRASGESFVSRRDRYLVPDRGTVFATSADLLACDDWTAAAVRVRTDRLISQLTEVWDLNDGEKLRGPVPT